MLALPVAAHAEDRAFVAVLDIGVGGEVISEDVAAFLTDQVRAATVRVVRAQYDVMIRETMAALVPVEDLMCFDDMCLADIGARQQSADQ